MWQVATVSVAQMVTVVSVGVHGVGGDDVGGVDGG